MTTHHARTARAARTSVARDLPSRARTALIGLAVTALGTVAAACGGPDGATDGAKAADDGAFKVALLTPGSISDQSWNGGAYDGLLAVRDSLGAEISHIQTKTPAEFEENFRQYGAQGYDLVIGHGFEFQDAALRVAPDYPNTVFICTSGNATAANVAGMNFAFEEASYQAGMIAGALTATGTIGAIGGTELPPVRASFVAFERGAEATRPDVQVLVAYLGNWEDVSAGREQALAQIGRGADVLFQNADAAGLGVLQAARERGVIAFGSNANQNDVAPETVVGSVVIDLRRALLTVADDVRSGRFRPQTYQLGLRAGVVRLELNEALAARIPAAIRTAVDSVGAVIRAGDFRVLDDVLKPADRDTP